MEILYLTTHQSHIQVSNNIAEAHQSQEKILEVEGIANLQPKKFCRDKHQKKISLPQNKMGKQILPTGTLKVH